MGNEIPQVGRRSSRGWERHLGHHPYSDPYAGPGPAHLGQPDAHVRAAVHHDRVLDEAHASADPVQIMRLFSLSSTKAMNYVAAAHPEKGVNLQK
ncbi:hypothetical protein ACWD4L_17635 [Streptomyces sp. NPDC002596]|uniref:hypothetical protein n=1 Tax=unclassified Streptomyces TaxID=2593676 RepID=UPI00225006D3|nr:MULTISPECIES: hypothetical protein [unclassified Streptomyces]MCX4537828.1 hypothetical protein [Streptomyces sp. NBC_01669]WSA05050.1 hypothetical protein OHA79_46325 [Streptomyces sp. NBC_00841]